MNSEYEKSIQPATSSQAEIEKSISDSNNMKEDILSSMNSVIIDVKEEDFRSVMSHYYSTLSELNQTSQVNRDKEIKVRTLSFKNEDNVCEALVKGLVIEWDDGFDEQTEDDEESQARTRQDLESDRENPIECLETEERTRGQMKSIGGLFCSFD